MILKNELLIISLFSATLVISTTTWAKSEIKQVNFHNIELSTLQNAKRVGPVAPQQTITFNVWLKLRNQEKFDHFINELYDPNSGHYQKFLSKDEFNANYAPSEKEAQEVESYFISQGMKTKRVYTTIQVTAEAKKIEQVLKIKLNNYLYKNKLVYGNDSEPRVNSEVAKYISGISDLSNIPYGHPKIRQEPTKKRKTLVEFQGIQPVETLNLIWDSFMPKALPTTTSLNGFTGQQMRTAYNLAGIAPINGTTIDGTGQTIVVIDGCTHRTPTELMNDANQYSSASSLPSLTTSNFTVVDYQGTPYGQPSYINCSGSGWDGEIALDIEASHTMAPGANIVLVLTNNINNTEVATTINTIINNNFSLGGFANAYVVSNSWDNNYDLQNEPLDATLQTAAGMGLSINFAAGDCGDQTYNSSWTCSKYGNTPSIQYPVSSAYVTAVAGTSLFVDANYNYAFESGWGNYLNGAPYSGSMGGISQWRNFPSWQAPITNFTAGGYGLVGSYNKRAIPDIAMVADYYTGLIIYEGGSFYKTGGASQSTPLFSGVLTLVNQARTLLNGGTPNPIGLAAPYFYTYNSQLISGKALNLITPPHQIISGATPVNNAPVGSPPPNSAFNIHVSGDIVTFNWDGVLSIIENQSWNDVVGTGSPNVPNFVSMMAQL
ncbi:Pseudomonalisin precursor [Legionella massiliensis]|uniref:Pseudomonalisin n=1 Tax=Legionella massiliensis TaxID=1034943 RepID=A0A078KZV7_9GAMM|nr:S53 family peptidase [Legionella massiliensis]CDZ77344.1 Pseudomonalisin precursor [Legionella massiliensis]CEE13082.1 Pseudomonalisin precursor [Legionella massiliensis]